MAQVQVKLVNAELMSNFYFTPDPVVLARKLLAGGLYEDKATLSTYLAGEDAAEELFDLTNNPSRQEERERDYGRGRSISVGDIVCVDGVNFLCASVGWTVV